MTLVSQVRVRLLDANLGDPDCEITKERVGNRLALQVNL